MIILFPQGKEWNTRLDCADEKAKAENPPPTPPTLTHSAEPPPQTTSLRHQPCPWDPPAPENLRGLDSRLWGLRAHWHHVERAHWPHCLCSSRGYSPQPASLFLPQAPIPLHISKYLINKHLDAWDRVLRAGALGWPWGMRWGGRWEGGFRMGNTCTPTADSSQCMAKPLQYCKVISLQLK